MERKEFKSSKTLAWVSAVSCILSLLASSMVILKGTLSTSTLIAVIAICAVIFISAMSALTLQMLNTYRIILDEKDIVIPPGMLSMKRVISKETIKNIEVTEKTITVEYSSGDQIKKEIIGLGCFNEKDRSALKKLFENL